jgi:hypothetical protein
VGVIEPGLASGAGEFTSSIGSGATGGARFENSEIDVANIEDYPRGFRPARVTAFRRGSGNPTYVQSKFTKLYYLKYPGSSHSCPFRRQANTTGDSEGSKEQQVYNEVKQTVLGSLPNGSRANIKDEHYAAL